MTELFENDESECHDEAIGRTTNALQSKSYMPWHKPRKQWVRENQWWKSLEKLLVDNPGPFSTEKSVKYFGLPGGELLDIDYLTKKMGESAFFNNRKLLVHGIVKSPGDKQTADSRLAELLDRSNVDPLSRVDRCNFEALENDSSMLWRNVKNVAPYHLVNLDFCDKVFEEKTIIAVHKLLEYQFSAILEKPWLFCLTTKIDNSNSNEEVLKRLDTCLHSIEEDELSIFNLQEHFEAVFTAISNKKNIREYADDEEIFTNIFLVGFVIWIVLKALTNDVQFKLMSSAKYRVSDSSSVPDMYSFVFEFKKRFVPKADLTGLAPHCGNHNQNTSDGLSPKEKIIRRLAATVDLDGLLSNDADKLMSCIQETKELLKGCGWNVSDYEDYMCPTIQVLDQSHSEE